MGDEVSHISAKLEATDIGAVIGSQSADKFARVRKLRDAWDEQDAQAGAIKKDISTLCSMRGQDGNGANRSALAAELALESYCTNVPNLGSHLREMCVTTASGDYDDVPFLVGLYRAPISFGRARLYLNRCCGPVSTSPEDVQQSWEPWLKQASDLISASAELLDSRAQTSFEVIGLLGGKAWTPSVDVAVLDEYTSDVQLDVTEGAAWNHNIFRETLPGGPMTLAERQFLRRETVNGEGELSGAESSIPCHEGTRDLSTEQVISSGVPCLGLEQDTDEMDTSGV